MAYYVIKRAAGLVQDREKTKCGAEGRKSRRGLGEVRVVRAKEAVDIAQLQQGITVLPCPSN